MAMNLRMDAVEASGLLAQGQIAPCRRPLLSNAARKESHDVSDPVIAACYSNTSHKTTHHFTSITLGSTVVMSPVSGARGLGFESWWRQIISEKIGSEGQ